MRRAYPALKRIIDVVSASILLLMLAPLMCIVFIAVKLTSNGPGLFWSTRVGLNGQPFNMPKFRTMTIESKLMSREIATDSDIKLTKIGNLLRKSSLDELPQLWNVLRGDMSLIGPRPLLVNDHAEGERSQRPEIYNVKPGITGLAQVNGRNYVTPRNKSRYDAFYAERVCMILDAKIAIKTVRAVLKSEMIK